MSSDAIPNWNAQGVLPPINSKSPTSLDDRSPYVVSLTELINRYATSPKRKAILEGLLKFRKALHAVGITSGFQWLDGSFLEDIEMIGSRPPNDIDVVTFYHLPNGIKQEDLLTSNDRLFTLSLTKVDYSVDAYFVTLNMKSPENLVKICTYWHSLWSHRKINGMWKGYLQVDLAPIEDDVAQITLSSIIITGGQL